METRNTQEQNRAWDWIDLDNEQVPPLSSPAGSSSGSSDDHTSSHQYKPISLSNAMTDSDDSYWKLDSDSAQKFTAIPISPQTSPTPIRQGSPPSPVSKKNRLSGQLSIILGTITRDNTKIIEGQVRKSGAGLALRNGERTVID